MALYCDYNIWPILKFARGCGWGPTERLSASIYPLCFYLIVYCHYRNGMRETKILSEEQSSTAMWSSILLGETGKPSKS